MFATDQPIVLTEAERTELEIRSRARSLPAADVQRARLILLLAGAVPWQQIRERLDCSRGYIARWKQRFVVERMEGLYPRHQGHRRGDEMRWTSIIKAPPHRMNVPGPELKGRCPLA